MDVSDFLTALDDDPFEEVPVDLDTFLSPEYLDFPPISKIQRDMIESMSQIFREEELVRIFKHKGAEKPYESAREFFKKYTKFEIILQLGKGSGKDEMTSIGVLYLVYKLMCLKDPARYFGKPSLDPIDIINIAINADQARTVFFKKFTTKLKQCKWFIGKYDLKMNSVEFPKAIAVYSGHSERESHEGLNLILAVLDEISGFAETSNTGNEQAKTSDAIYKAFFGTVTSRYPEFGKVISLSFPRYKDDFISKKYNAAIAQKEVIEREHTFIINEDGDPDDPRNRYTVKWEEEHVLSYAPGYERAFAIKAPTWDVNPIQPIEFFKTAFLQDPVDALQRYACMGASISDAFIKNMELLKKSMNIRNPVDEFNRIDQSWRPQDEKIYFVHADLAQKQDRAAVALAHVEKWVDKGKIVDYDRIVPLVVVDMIAYWEPKPGKPIDLKEVRDWIIRLKEVRQVPVKLVTFDRWGSVDIQLDLQAVGIQTDTLSVALKHYDDLAFLVYDSRVNMPVVKRGEDNLLYDELSQIQIVSKTQVDHPRKGSKDLADAVVGATYNAIANTPKNLWGEVDVRDIDDTKSEPPEIPIEKPEMPKEIEDYLNSIGVL